LKSQIKTPKRPKESNEVEAYETKKLRLDAKTRSRGH